MKKTFYYRWLCTMAILLIAFSCKKHEDALTPSGVTASFQYAVDGTNFLKVQFNNFSVHYTSLAWDFGDGSTSTDESPAHTYAAAGTYNVTLTATGADKVTSAKSQSVTLSDPNTELEKLTGTVNKSWKLLRIPNNGSYPLQTGPIDRSQIWWASGRDEDIGVRPCAFNDEFIFELPGKAFVYKTHGDIWEDGSIWPSYQCADTAVASTWVSSTNADLTGWDGGTHTFDYDVAGKKLTVNGKGAFIGLVKAGTTDQVSVPQTSVTYNVVRLYDGPTDTLVLETTFGAGTSAPGYWRFILVHYDTPSQEPAIPGAKPSVGFTYVVNDHDVAFTNTTSSTGTTSYSWDFGDGSTSTEISPSHHFASDGSFDVLLSATNPTGTATSTQTITLSSVVLTDALLNGGGSKTWMLKPGVGTFEVGPAISNGSYYGGNIDLSGDRPCLFNDEFIFKTGGVYQYDAQGDEYVEGYWGEAGAGGCTTEANVTGPGAIWTSNTFTYTFTPVSGTTPATITVNGLGAFIALPKEYNGGEFTAPPTTGGSITYQVVSYASDGTTDTLVIAIDYTGNGTGFWTFTLTSPH